MGAIGGGGVCEMGVAGRGGGVEERAGGGRKGNMAGWLVVLQWLLHSPRIATGRDIYLPE